MKLNARIRGRAQKNDVRNTSFWVDELTLKTSNPEEAFELAAIKAALLNNEHPRFQELANAIRNAAVVCRSTYMLQLPDAGAAGSFQKNDR